MRASAGVCECVRERAGSGVCECVLPASSGDVLAGVQRQDRESALHRRDQP